MHWVKIMTVNIDEKQISKRKGKEQMTHRLIVVTLRNLEQHLLGSIIDLLHVLWCTNLGKKETATDGGGASALEQETAKYLPLPLINEFLCVAFAITCRLR